MRILTSIGPGAVGEVDSAYAWVRLLASVLVSTIGGVGMWSIAVVLPAIATADQGVHGDDRGMFELASDPRLLEEARFEGGICGVFGPQLFKGNVPSKVAVVGQPDASDAAGRVQAEPMIAIRL